MGLAGALQAPQDGGARARYAPDGRGGLVGAFEDAAGRVEETLTPLGGPDDATRVERARAGDPIVVLGLAREARAGGLAAARRFFDGLVAAGGLYPALDAAAPPDRRALFELAREVATPSPVENAAAEQELARLRAAGELGRFAYSLIVVPGFTPTDAPRLHDLHDRARDRCARAAADFRAGRAPFVLATGGAVHPAGTPVAEARQLEAELLRLGVPAERILVDPLARHSTTNLRNAGRFMLARGLSRPALVVTSRGQSFYFSHPGVSTYHARCRRELGYEVGRLRRVDAFRTAFTPAARCQDEGADPLDP